MRQRILCVVLEVQPESQGRLLSIIEMLKRDEENLGPGIPQYSRIAQRTPALHFISLSVFSAADYDPQLVIEVNFDGPAGPFWAQLEAALSDYLRDTIRCCKCPSDRDGPLYDAITADDSRYPLALYLERRAIKPSAFHQGNRGLDRDRILREGELFRASRVELAEADANSPNAYYGISAQTIHLKLRAALLPRFPWLDQPAAGRISVRERLWDMLTFLRFALAVIFVLSVPGLVFLTILQAFYPVLASRFIALNLMALLTLLIAPLAAGLLLYRTASARPGEFAPSRSGGLTPSTKNGPLSLANPFMLVAAFLSLLALVSVVIAFLATAAKTIVDAVPAGDFIKSATDAFRQSWGPILRITIVGVYTALVFSLPAIFVWLRWLERRDSRQDQPSIDAVEMRRMTRREDWIPQNHMGSIVLIRPGTLRTVLLHAGHWGLRLVLRIVATNGYLGSMRTIHFAHWAFIDNGSRLLFLSNFDHSWDSYLDDFIEKAHGGLTLAWSSCVGFPSTRFLVLDGASHGRQFKVWARHSMAVSRFWFSAYKDYTVDQIERQYRVARGLRRQTLTAEEAREWARDL